MNKQKIQIKGVWSAANSKKEIKKVNIGDSDRDSIAKVVVGGILKYMEDNDLSQIQAAEILGISKQRLSHYLKFRRLPKIEMYYKLQKMGVIE